ncbi:hypothetical protein L7F22_067317 [Adiantum nelumboides]|nr:hypothetical protein [Adiantum nelumboides]
MASPAFLSEPQIDELHLDRAMDHSFEPACLDDQASETNGFENAGAFSERDACMENGDGHHFHEVASLGGCDGGDHEHTWMEHSAATTSAEAGFEDDEAEGEVQSADLSGPALKKTGNNARRKSFGGISSYKVVSPPVIVRTAKPSISSKLTSAPRNKHVTPCSLDPNHSHHHRSPPVTISLYRNFLKSSSPAALARRGDSEHGDDTASPSCLNPPNRRHSLGSSLNTPSSKRASLDSKTYPASKLTKSASPRVDTRRASISGPILSKSISELSRSPSLKGSLQSPRGSSARPSTPDSAKRRSPSAASSRSTSKPVSPRTSIASLSSPRARSSPSNGVPSMSSGRKRATPIFTQNTKIISSSVDSPGSNISRRKSLTSDSRDPRFIALPSVDAKAGDDVRLDLRGQKVRSLDCNLVNLTPKMEQRIGSPDLWHFGFSTNVTKHSRAGG